MIRSAMSVGVQLFRSAPYLIVGHKVGSNFLGFSDPPPPSKEVLRDPTLPPKERGLGNFTYTARPTKG